MWITWMDSFGSGQRQVRTSCLYGNEHSGSMKCSEYLDEMRNYQLVKQYAVP
jgi:hypothetical protein